MIAGDLVVRNRTKTLLDSGQCETLFSELRTVAEGYDYRLLNLESPIVQGAPEKIVKVGPHLSCDEKVTDLLRYGLFDGVTLANNHFRDYGDKGVADTLRLLDQHGIDHVGGGLNINEASATLFKTIGGERLAVVNCAEHEFSIATESSGGANPLNPVRQYYAIREARAKADFVVVITHGGVEQYELPTLRMKETYRFFIDAGADAVVNHHQHCYSGYEVYQGKPIFYGLGNLCFDYPQYRNHKWNKGFVLGLQLHDHVVEYDLLPYVQSDERPGVVMLDVKGRRGFDEDIKQKNKVIGNDEALEEALRNSIQKSRVFYSSLFTPYTSKWALALYSRGLLPSFLPRRKWLELLNKMECESHRDRLIGFVKDKLGL